MSLADASELLGFSSAKLSMMENALHPTEPAEVIALGLAYRVKGDVWKHIAKRAAGEPSLRAADDLDEVHPEVSVLRGYGAGPILLLLRSPEYSARSDSETDQLKFEFVVTEQAVRGSADGSSDGRAALVNVVRLAERGRVSIRVSPDPPGREHREEASFVHLSFRHKQHDDVVFVERGHTGSYIEDPLACQLMSQAFEALQRSALDPQDSINFIAESAEGRPRL